MNTECNQQNLSEDQKTLQYKRDHIIAKAIILMLYLLVGALGIENQNPYLALIVGTPIWLFGINTLAYLVESLLGHAHGHNLL